MRRNAVLLSREKADHTRQVRAEIGRGLRKEYDAGAWPMPNRLADLLEKLSSSGPGEEGCMSKSDEYRAKAQECERMAGISRNPDEKVAWLQMAGQWLGMIPKAGPAKSEQFDAAEHANRAGQTKSEESR
jgi:hypothetical protein